MTTNSIVNNITKLRENVASAAQKYDRGIGGIGILAVSKTRGQEDIRSAYALGLQDFGEN